MPRYARIADATVAEIIDLPDDVAVEDAFHPDIARTIIACPDPGVSEGYAYVDGGFQPPTPAEAAPSSIPEEISDRQFAHGLWKQSVISFEEARAFVKVGDVPPALQDLIDQMPASVRQDTQLLVEGATTFQRHNPATVALLQMFGWTDEVADEFWRYAFTL